MAFWGLYVGKWAYMYNTHPINKKENFNMNSSWSVWLHQIALVQHLAMSTVGRSVLVIWKTLTCRQSLLPACGQLTPISGTLGYKPWCHGGTCASVLMVTAWGQVYHLPCIHASQNKTQTDCVHYLIFWNSFCVFVLCILCLSVCQCTTRRQHWYSATKYSVTASKESVIYSWWNHSYARIWTFQCFSDVVS
jgi:hypothetical protein